MGVREEVDFAPVELSGSVYRPLMTVQLWASVVGLPVGVVSAQVENGYWPTVRIGKRVLVNAEAVRRAAVEAGSRFEFKS